MVDDEAEIRIQVQTQALESYLGARPPFHAMAAADRAALARAATSHDFAAGEVVVDYAAGAPAEIWVLRTGRVVLTSDGTDEAEPVDVVEPGGVFGYLPLLSHGKVTFVARTVEPSTALRLPGELVRTAFTNPDGLSYLASSAWDVISTRSRAQQPSLTAVGDLVPGPPVFTDPGASVRDAVRHMTAHKATYVLARLPDGTLGIFTDRDLRSRVVAADVPLDAPIGSVMSSPARTVTADRAAATVLMDMLESGLRHLPVLDRLGRVLGVVEESDVVASGTRQSFLVRRAIALAADATELAAAATRVRGLAVDLFRGGTDAAGTSAVLSVVTDAVVRRALELEWADAAPRWRPRVAWLTMGSVARREAMPSSDVDSALSWAQDADQHAAALRGVARRVHVTLDACGLPADTNGAVAFEPRFSRSTGQWTDAAVGWLTEPLRDRGLMMSSLLLDARVVWGNAALHTAPEAFSRMPAEHPNALRLQLLDALSDKPRTRSLRDVVARRGGTFDLKAHALTPIVNLARWGGLTVGMVSGSTPARLAAAAGNGLLTDADATALREVFDLLQRLRMAHQIDQLAAGVPPGDVITLAELSPLSRSLLGDGLRQIAAVQRRVRGQAAARALQGG